MSRRSIIGEALSGPSPDQVRPALPADPSSDRQTVTNRRLEGFSEAAKIVKRPTIRLKPSECSIWDGNARDYALLDEERLASLIESIKAENGNRIPVVVRRTPKGDKPYELVIGTRRHWATAWLNANHYSNIELIATIEEIDDEAAFRLADVENREREDISDLERGRNYLAALKGFYNGNQSLMAERMGMKRPTLIQYLGLAELPAEIIAAFATPLDLQARHGSLLAPLLKDEHTRAKLLAEAGQISAEQSYRSTMDDKPLAGNDVVNRLVSAAKAKLARREPSTIKAGTHAIGKFQDRKRGLTLAIEPNALSVDEILNALRPILEAARCRKPG